MTNSDNFWKGLLALGGALLCSWAYIESRKALEKNWQENNLLGTFVSAGAAGAAYAGTIISLKELLRLLQVPIDTLPSLFQQKKHNPFRIPDYSEYPR
jgi:hypothetical protein